MRGTDSALPFSNAAAGTSTAFKLIGGRYLLEVAAGGSAGTVTLNKLGPDGVTFLTVAPVTPAITAAGTVLYDLPLGNYQLVVTVLTAIYAAITRVPGE